jgi:hypothetical protein
MDGRGARRLTTFNAKTSKTAVRGGCYCSQHARVPTSNQYSYPYYYDRYRDFVSHGGVMNAAPAETCPRRPSPIWSGFGTTRLDRIR